jgi:IS5 family transposase
MKRAHQMSLGDYQVQQNRKTTRSEQKLAEIEGFVNWGRIVDMFSIIDKTDPQVGGRPRKEILMMCKVLFIQYLYNLSDPDLEDQLNDRLSFQRFAGLSLDTSVPDHSTIWRFKEALIKAGLTDRLFEMITNDLERKGLFVKKGTIVDATIIKSSNRPLSRQRRQELSVKPSSQVDMDAQSMKKNGKYYFGYKGHIGTDVESKLIRSRRFTSANVHDSTETEKLLIGDEKSLLGDKAYSKDEIKRRSRESGFYYGILDKARRGQKLSNKQRRRNKRLSSIRSQVEHPFAYMKRILNLDLAMAKTLPRNELRFTMNCIVYNIMRANQLIRCPA